MRLATSLSQNGQVNEFLVTYLDSIDEHLLDYLDEDDELSPEIVKRLRYYTTALQQGTWMSFLPERLLCRAGSHSLLTPKDR